MKTQALRWALASLLTVSSPHLAAQAAATPKLPDVIRVIVPFSAGSGVDVLARGIAEQMHLQSGKSFVVENINGAGGTIGASQVAKARTDGQTLLFTANPPFVTGPLLQNNNAYQASRDFTPIAQLATTPMILIATREAPFDSLESLMTHARENPGKLDFASTGIGTPSHLSVETIARHHDAELQAIHYTSAAQAMTDTISGQVPIYMPSYPAAMGSIQGGLVKPLAIGSIQRLAMAPEIPTVAELLGQPDLALEVWYGLLGPADMKEELVIELAELAHQATQTTKVTELLEKSGMTASYMDPGSFPQQLLQDEVEGEALLRSLGVL